MILAIIYQPFFSVKIETEVNINYYDYIKEEL